jgi:hypothetical protein
MLILRCSVGQGRPTEKVYLGPRDWVGVIEPLRAFPDPQSEGEREYLTEIKFIVSVNMKKPHTVDGSEVVAAELDRRLPRLQRIPGVVSPAIDDPANGRTWREYRLNDLPLDANIAIGPTLMVRIVEIVPWRVGLGLIFLGSLRKDGFPVNREDVFQDKVRCMEVVEGQFPKDKKYFWPANDGCICRGFSTGVATFPGNQEPVYINLNQVECSRGSVPVELQRSWHRCPRSAPTRAIHPDLLRVNVPTALELQERLRTRSTRS